MMNKPFKFLALTACGSVMVAVTGCMTSPQPASTPARLPVTLAPQAAPPSDLESLAASLRTKKGPQQPVIGLVLGSGGARGYAHIGVINVLEAQQIKPDFIVGTSAGSIVGALYASGKTASQIQRIATGIKSSDIRDLTFSKQGFFDSKKIENYVNQQTGHLPLEQLPIPLFIVATELSNGTRTVFNRGNTGQAVAASVSIPSMFVPARIGSKYYVDGGLVSPVPVEVAKSLGADIVIAVNILAQPEHTATTNMWGLFNQNINVMQNRLASYELKHADVVIQPNIRQKQHIFSLHSRYHTIKAGEDAARLQLDKIRGVLKEAQARISGVYGLPQPENAPAPD